VHDSTGKITVACQYVRGTRFDDIDSPDYMYADCRGHLRRFGKLLCDGPVVVLKNKNEPWEVIPIQEGPNPCKTLAVALPGGAGMTTASVTALDKNRDELGKADCRMARGMLHIFPKEGEFSYLIDRGQPLQTMGWSFDDLHYVVPGMRWGDPRLTIPAEPGSKAAAADMETLVGFHVPEDVVPGTIHWVSGNSNWHDFIVLPLCDLDAEYDNDTAQLTVTIRSNFPQEIDYMITLNGIETPAKTIRLVTDQKTPVVFDLDKPTQPVIRDIEIVATAKNEQNTLTQSKSITLKMEK
jgi:hypothetical protein